MSNKMQLKNLLSQMIKKRKKKTELCTVARLHMLLLMMERGIAWVAVRLGAGVHYSMH